MLLIKIIEGLKEVAITLNLINRNKDSSTT
jgi:hypothetical protein